MRGRKLLTRLQDGQLDNVDFDDFIRLIQAYDLVHLRTTGSRAIFGRTESRANGPTASARLGEAVSDPAVSGPAS